MKMIKFFVLSMALLSFTTYASQKYNPVPVGGNEDEHGCLSTAGYSWSVLKQECVQPFSVADISFTDPSNGTLAIYVILSEDKAQAEVFSAHLPSQSIFQVIKGGYISKDGKTRLIKTKQGWQLKNNQRINQMTNKIKKLER